MLIDISLFGVGLVLVMSSFLIMGYGKEFNAAVVLVFITGFIFMILSVLLSKEIEMERIKNVGEIASRKSDLKKQYIYKTAKSFSNSYRNFIFKENF